MGCSAGLASLLLLMGTAALVALSRLALLALLLVDFVGGAAFVIGASAAGGDGDFFFLNNPCMSNQLH